MSKIDELVRIYFRAANTSTFPQYETPDHRAGIAAVVRALRDEIDRVWIGEDMGCGTILDVFNQILGSDAGNEKVAGGSTREESGTDEKRGSKPLRKDGAEVSPRLPDPATDPCPRCGYPAQDQCDSPGCNIDPAPAVCVWTPRKNMGWFQPSCRKSRMHETSAALKICPSCGLPIKFTEAK